jgi:hypothetical protein
MLGHASAAVALDLYGHLFEDELDAVADRLNAAARASRMPGWRPDPAVVPIARREPVVTRHFVVPPAGFEPAAHGLGNRCSIP